MERAPKEAECAEGGTEECEAYVAAKLVLFIGVEDSGKRAWKSSVLRWSSSERKVTGAVEDFLERCGDTKIGY